MAICEGPMFDLEAFYNNYKKINGVTARNIFQLKGNWHFRIGPMNRAFFVFDVHQSKVKEMMDIKILVLYRSVYDIIYPRNID